MSYDCQQTLSTTDDITYFSLKTAMQNGLGSIDRLPISLKVLLENQLRNLDKADVSEEQVDAFATWQQQQTCRTEIAYRVARVLMQDLTGVPAVVDLAAMRDAMQKLGGTPTAINPLIPVDLVIDHSVHVDHFANPQALTDNVKLEMQRNAERYRFLRWGQQAFDNFRVVPPGTGICHQVNLEYLAPGIVVREKDGKQVAFPDTLVGTDSHTTMINALGVLGWGVGGIEAEAAMLGQPISMLIPDVIGVRFTGKLPQGATATDLVLQVTQVLRTKGVVGKFVEYCGPSLDQLPLADRATLSNMAPEYGATCGFFPVDQETLDYLRLSGRPEKNIALLEAYCKAQGMWHSADTPEPVFTDVVEIDLSTVEPCVAGPKRPQDRVALKDLAAATAKVLQDTNGTTEHPAHDTGDGFSIQHGDVMIAAITSCTNTSNPSVMLAAGLLAQKAQALGLKTKPWVKTSLAPGSKVVTDYLNAAGVMPALESLGFAVVGYGCTTCIGNSGPLSPAITNTIRKNKLTACAVLSGNRNFEGRIHPWVKANWLASPPLVVAFALAGNTRINLQQDPLGEDSQGNPVYLKDIWPSTQEIDEAMQLVKRDMFQQQYADVFKGDATWQSLEVADSQTYAWEDASTYVRLPSFFENLQAEANPTQQNIVDAHILALFGDSITTDHISPAGAIAEDSPAALYLQQHAVQKQDFNSYGSRRGNHEVMMRGTFANIRIRNKMLQDVEGGYTRHIPSGEQLSIYDTAMRYIQDKTPTVVIAGKEYGTGSSRDWAAKGTLLLGVKAVIAESFERIHRSNLIGMGVLPLRFNDGQSWQQLGLDGSEKISITGLEQGMQPNMQLQMHITDKDGTSTTVPLTVRIETENELNYYKNAGILSYVLRKMYQSNPA